MKKLIVLGFAIACIIFMNQFPHVMLNPGDLVEAHQNINNKCLACHDPFSGISNDKCISCHKLSSIGMDTLLVNESNVTNEKVLFHQHLSNQKCTACHTEHKGEKPEMSLSSFNHDMLPSTVISKCNSCHSQPSNQLHKQVTTNCKNCHNTEGWKSSVSFNHDMIIGADKNNCASCHIKPSDTFHQQIKENCDKCHSTNQWKPSTFDHSTYFQLDENHNAKCNTCHTNNNFSAFTCYGCHEHSESNIREEHHENGIYNYSNCATCHKSGNEHDIRMNGKSNLELNESELNNMKKYIKSQDNNKGRDGQKEQDDD
ncbi:MAG: class III cytochrome C family protein [Bacteroidetes bacterium]|nr:class III cytochrome C family protein [Bacteroidota bacterium]